MARKKTSLDLTLPPQGAGVPTYRWLYSTLRTAILDGRLRPGTRLPATRDLANQYRLSRGTIVNAFDLLASEGYLGGRVGSGTYVNERLPDDLLRVTPAGQSPRFTQRQPSRYPSDYAKRVQAWPPLAVRPTHAFRANIPALDLFPMELWSQVSARRFRRAPTSLLVGCDPMGHMPLRCAIADYLTTSRGLQCVAEQVAVVSGIQEAVDVVSRVFLNPGDRAAVENPGYPGAVRVFAAAGARIVAVPVNDEGILAQASRLRNCRLVYVTPAHQFPTGVTMSLRRRLSLLEWARNTGALIVEDDYDSEFRYAGRPVPALQGLDRSGVVLFAGSFNKVLFPSLRLGYLVVPPDIVKQVHDVKSLMNRHHPVLDQAALCDFITDGHFGRHLRRMRQIYAERLSVLIEAGREKLSGVLEISSVEAGLQTVGWLRNGLTGERATALAAGRGIEVFPISRYGHGRTPDRGLSLGFAAVDPSEIKRGVRELAMALDGAARRPS